jgi:hypothetical protein
MPQLASLLLSHTGFARNNHVHFRYQSMPIAFISHSNDLSAHYFLVRVDKNGVKSIWFSLCWGDLRWFTTKRTVLLRHIV